MKKMMMVAAAALFIGSLHAQTTLKATKPISKTDWDTYYTEFFSYSYGTVSVINDKGVVERLTGDKPANPQDKVSWRPPPIPPTDNPDNPTGVKPVKVKGGKVGSIKPKPIDPGCNVCSVFIIPAEAPSHVAEKLKNVLQQYN
ncbi:MAG: hypothetical protein JNM88_11585 [Chitinophagaceae bacterium]|nr:hypothetical protein [Chitinophagaceae bacterium]